jgi:DNA-binding protein WhiA
VQKINNRRIYKLTLEGNFEQINSDLQLNEIYPKQILGNSINVRAYLAGAFLSGGSINSVEKSNYHLEIRSSKLQYLRLIQKLLQPFNISITLLKRKNNYVLYIKKAANVSDFLKIIGANSAMMQLEEVIISRDYYNNVQKLNNLDIANLRKSSVAGQTQVMMINRIRKSKLFKEQPDKFKFYCSLKLQNPEASLTEMVHIFQKKYQINMTRTGINHYVLKIKKIFNSNLKTIM